MIVNGEYQQEGCTVDVCTLWEAPNGCLIVEKLKEERGV